MIQMTWDDNRVGVACEVRFLAKGVADLVAFRLLPVSTGVIARDWRTGEEVPGTSAVGQDWRLGVAHLEAVRDLTDVGITVGHSEIARQLGENTIENIRAARFGDT